MLSLCFDLFVRFGWMQELKSSSPIPSAWVHSLPWEATILSTTTLGGKNKNTFKNIQKMYICDLLFLRLF